MIWCVEDDASIRDIEVYALQSTGFEAKGFEDGTSFWEALRTGRPELVVLDVMLPGIDGMELLRRMRADAALSDIPVVMATAKGAEYDKIRGLDLGADYYLTKPFGVMELVSCVKAVLRRCGTKSASQFRCGGLVLDEESHTVTADGESVALTYKEFELLRLFLSHPGTAFSRDQLMADVWGTDYCGETRTVVSGIAKSYAPEDIVGREVVLVANLKPARLRGIESQGMILCATDGDGVVLVSPEKPVSPGSEVC
jgi:two-component system alkaline phosphatase synthesis response regulator PhoP